MSALAEFPERIMKLFLIKSVSKFGCYFVRVCFCGAWKIVILDDFFPMMKIEGKLEPAFTKGSVWVMLLEKAWAKLFGNYERIESGIPREVLRALTGAPTKVVYTDSQNL